MILLLSAFVAVLSRGTYFFTIHYVSGSLPAGGKMARWGLASDKARPVRPTDREESREPIG